MTAQSLDLFTPSPCGCGTGPALVERDDEVEILTWCLCPDLVSVVAPTLGEALILWEAYNGKF